MGSKSLSIDILIRQCQATDNYHLACSVSILIGSTFIHLLVLQSIAEVVAQIRNGDKIGIMVFLHHGGDVNARNSMGWTLLHIACFEGRTEIVELLLDNGALVSTVRSLP